MVKTPQSGISSGGQRTESFYPVHSIEWHFIETSHIKWHIVRFFTIVVVDLVFCLNYIFFS